ncbi:MAG: hypothetical protein WAL52_10435 [Candidatus Sulfotelmatobacter sp.]
MIRRKNIEGRVGDRGDALLATVYPLVAMHLEESLQMMLSIYVTLGVLCCWRHVTRQRIAA